MAHLFSPAGTELTVSTEDALWLARAIEAEGEPREKVGQVLINRWAWLFDRNPRLYPTLTSLIRAYAQPVNPRWYPGGELSEEWIRNFPADEAAERARAIVRRDVHSTRSEFTEKTRHAVASALYGPVTIPPGAVHFGKAREGVNQILVSPDARGALYSPLAVGGLELPHARTLDQRHGAFGVAILGLGAGLAFALAHGLVVGKRPRRR